MGYRPNFGRRLIVVAAVLVVGALAACDKDPLFTPHRVENQPQAGSVNVAVTLVSTWDAYVEALAPNFSLTAEAALDKVIPQTTILEEKVLDALAVTAQVGLPQSSISSTATERKGPNPLSSRERTKTLRQIKGDPVLEYTAATALYQEVQLLNRYVADAAQKRGFTPYVVRAAERRALRAASTLRRLHDHGLLSAGRERQALPGTRR